MEIRRQNSANIPIGRLLMVSSLIDRRTCIVLPRYTRGHVEPEGVLWKKYDLGTWELI